MTTTVVYPDANTVDGRVVRGSVNETLATIRGGAGNGSSYTDTTYQAPRIIASTTTNQFTHLYRAIFLFPTNDIPSGDVVSSATLSLRASAKAMTFTGTGPEVDIVNSTPASDTVLANSDYGNVGTTIYGSKAYADVSTSAYTDITLSTSAVTKAGVTKLGARLNWDTDNSFGATWGSSQNAGFTWYFSDYTGTTNDPKLTVVHASADTTVALNALSLTATLHDIVVVPGDVTVALDKLALTGTMPQSTLVPGGIEVMLDMLALVSNMISITVRGGDSTIALDLLTLTATLHDITVETAATTILLNNLLLTGVLKPISVAPGEATVALDLLALNALFHQATLEASRNIIIYPIHSTLTMHHVNVVPGNIDIPLSTLDLRGALLNLSLVTSVDVPLGAIALTGTVHPFTLDSPVTIPLGHINATLDMLQADVIPGNVTIQLDPLQLIAYLHRLVPNFPLPVTIMPQAVITGRDGQQFTIPVTVGSILFPLPISPTTGSTAKESTPPPTVGVQGKRRPLPN